MFAQFGANSAAVYRAAVKLYRKKSLVVAGIAAVAASLGGCIATAPPLIGADPADPGAKVAGVAYRSTTVPYTRMRPTAPAAWGGQDSDAPASKTNK